MAILNIGSINVDYVYQTPHLVEPGETLMAKAFSKGLGGKGMNQSIALHRAGAKVMHVGAMNQADSWLQDALKDAGIDDQYINKLDKPSGHAIIEVDADGENRIILYPGCNAALDATDLRAAFEAHPDVQYVLTQNETNALDDIFALCAEYGKQLVFNPAPCDPTLRDKALSKVAILIVNEVELQQLGQGSNLEESIQALRTNLPQTDLLITLGSAGVRYVNSHQDETIAGVSVAQVVDTTAAGDTFIGYFLAALTEKSDVVEAIHLANQAAALAVTRHGAAESIPYRHELT